MAEHPVFPMHNGLHRSQVVGRAGSSYAKLTFNLYHDSASATSTLFTTGNWEFQIHELNNNTAKNWVRTLYDFTEAVDNSTYASPGAVGLIDSQVLNFNVDANKHYAIRGSYDDNMTSVVGSTHDDGNYYAISQAAAISDFSSSSESDIAVTNPASLGSGFPAVRYGNAFQYPLTFKPSHNGSTGNAIWMFVNIS